MSPTDTTHEAHRGRGGWRSVVGPLAVAVLAAAVSGGWVVLTDGPWTGTVGVVALFSGTMALLLAAGLAAFYLLDRGYGRRVPE